MNVSYLIDFKRYIKPRLKINGSKWICFSEKVYGSGNNCEQAFYSWAWHTNCILGPDSFISLISPKHLKQ